MRITAKVTDRNPVHSRLSVWVNGGLIVNPGGICLKNEEVEGFLDHLKISTTKVTAKLRSMMERFERDDVGDPTTNLEKRIVLQEVLTYVEQESRTCSRMVDGLWEVKDK